MLSLAVLLCYYQNFTLHAHWSSPVGAFVLFIGLCVVALLYTNFIIPETAGMSFEEIDRIFERPLFLRARLLEPSEHFAQDQ